MCEQTEGLKLARVSETTRTYRTQAPATLSVTLHNINVAHKLQFLLKGHKQDPVGTAVHTARRVRRTSGKPQRAITERGDSASNRTGARCPKPLLQRSLRVRTLGDERRSTSRCCCRFPPNPYVPTAKRLQDGENI